MTKVKSFAFNPFMENTYVVYDDSKACVVVDPGCYEEYEKDTLRKFIDNEGLTVTYLLNTHCHVDHVLGNRFVKSNYHVELGIHVQEEPILDAVVAYAPNYGITNYEAVKPDFFLNEGDTVKFGHTVLNVIFVPGHAPGHIAFFCEKEKFCLVGDVLFEGSVGRSDLPGGNHEVLIKSIREKIFPLGDDVVVYPGHGNPTTVGVEKRTNPFCAII